MCVEKKRIGFIGNSVESNDTPLPFVPNLGTSWSLQLLAKRFVTVEAVSDAEILGTQKKPSVGVLRRSFFWKYAVNLQETTHAEVRFQ